MNNASWQRPQTTRVYLHPPRAERMLTLWREGKIVLSENQRGKDSHSYQELECVGLWPVHTKYARAFDFRRNRYSIHPDGIPVHRLQMGFGGFHVECEAFCSVERRCGTYVRYTFTNTAPTPATELFGLIPRRGNEKQLISGSPDEYCSHCPEAATFLAAGQSFTYADGVLEDEHYRICIDSELAFTYDEEKGVLFTRLKLAAGASATLTLFLSHQGAESGCYEEEKQKVLSFWEGELARITRLTPQVRNDPRYFATVKNLCVQILQCFCHYQGEKALIPRQGGLQKLIWQWEAIPMLEALHTIGDFRDYLQEVFRLYFEDLQADNGEILPIGENWANITGSALYSLARYCTSTDDAPLWSRYRDGAMKAFDWIQQKRALSAQVPGAFVGIFPPMRANDWGEQYQAWASTDICNLRAYQALKEALTHFHDPAAHQVCEAYEDYLQALQAIYAPFSQAAKDSKVLRLPLTADGNDQWLVDAFHPILYHGRMVDSDIIPEEDAEKIRRWLKENGMAKNGLYGHMPYPDGNTHIWYTSNPDYPWFMKDIATGKRESAMETLEAQYRYSMTEEYYMVERYHDEDPYYVPWSPNASASGRLILMLMAL